MAERSIASANEGRTSHFVGSTVCVCTCIIDFGAQQLRSVERIWPRAKYRQKQGHVRVIVSFGTAIASCGYIFECALYISAFVMYFLPHSLFRAVTVL